MMQARFGWVRAYSMYGWQCARCMGWLVAIFAWFGVAGPLPVCGADQVKDLRQPELAVTQLKAPECSVAGFYSLADCGREVVSVNSNWRFIRKDVAGAEKPEFDDSMWEEVNLPHGLELLPANASGCINYRGPAWYRTRITLPAAWVGKRITLHFEAVMGRGQVWIDGRQVADHRGGYLPIVIDATGLLKAGSPIVVAVRADNKDDPTTPPGKPAHQLDFCYFGGIYRDAWLIASEPVHITDPNAAGIAGGGGVLVHTTLDSAEHATLLVRTHVAGPDMNGAKVKLSAVLRDSAGAVVVQELSEGRLSKDGNVFEQRLAVKSPSLWTPDTPVLYNLEMRLTSEDGKALDGGRLAVGLRTIEFRGKEGFWLNGKPFPDKLMGTNRHQDYGYIGNALPNSLHWRDAILLRSSGMRVIRGHYPQDPAFLDACDRFGLFVINATAGWQFWNANDPVFEQRVYSDIRNLVRRDRNHACLLFWEPILNETHYPATFPKNARDAVREEYPYAGGAYCAGDMPARDRRGNEVMDIYYARPVDMRGTDKSVFTREWGDNVDDWRSQNSDARIAREWGEYAQLVQATHLMRPPYDFLCYADFYAAPRQHIGGCQWHSFDHQRGYAPEPFLGGLRDVLRQPKYSSYAFASQRDPAVTIPGVETGPMLFVAWEMSPYSPADIPVYSNCEEVRLTAFRGQPVTLCPIRDPQGLPHPPVVFTNVYNFMKVKSRHRSQKSADAVIQVDGLIGGKVVVSRTINSPKRMSRFAVTLADAGVPLVADGSDIMPVVAAIVDEQGNPMHFRSEDVVFSISGEGRIVGGESIGANPIRTGFGTAPVLVRSTGKPGNITVKARPRFLSSVSIQPGALTFTSVPPALPLLAPPVVRNETNAVYVPSIIGTREDSESINAAIDNVGKQQADFETTPVGNSEKKEPARESSVNQ